MYGMNPLLPKIGGLAVAVPGELRGLEEMHSKWGRLPWKRLVEPVAVLATGWNVSAELGHRLQVRSAADLTPQLTLNIIDMTETRKLDTS
jgi:gamma-glutamyltranspeptidase/glutathione hydrolase/leukotriene-C4 hydrolase